MWLSVDLKELRTVDKGGFTTPNPLDQATVRGDQHMRDVVVQETLEDIDKDGDGEISVDEYIGDMYNGDQGDEAAEPDWVKTEREQFKDFRDKNGDGNLTKDELPKGRVTLYVGHMDFDGNEIIEKAEIDKFMEMFNNGRGFDSANNDGG